MSALADADVEGLARALGAWYDGEGVVELSRTARPWVLTRDGDGFRVLHFELTGIVPDTTTAAILLLGHARGLRLDLGECPACRARGSKRGLARWEWVSTPYWAPGPIGDAWVRGEAFGPAPRWASRWARSCPACTVDGKPTGRESIDWATAVARAMPRDLGYDARRYQTPEAAEQDSEAMARITGRDPSRYETRPDPNGDGWRIHDIAPGDPGTRESLGVLADQLQADGDPFGVWLTAWLLDDGGATLAGYLGDIAAAVRAETRPAEIKRAVRTAIEHVSERATRDGLAAYVGWLLELTTADARKCIDAHDAWPRHLRRA